jgi:prevent-host-death family protein
LTRVTAHQAKSQLPRLLRAVAEGETVVITRYGKPVAQLVAIEGEARDLVTARSDLHDLRQRLPRIPLPELLTARHQGHRY